MSETQVYLRQEFAFKIKVSESTLKRWAKQKILVPNRGPGGRPFYTDEHLQQYLSLSREQF